MAWPNQFWPNQRWPNQPSFTDRTDSHFIDANIDTGPLPGMIIRGNKFLPIIIKSVSLQPIISRPNNFLPIITKTLQEG